MNTGSADILYVFDEFGSPILQGQDIDRNGILEPASMDRITGTNTQYASYGNNWYQETVTHTYASPNSDEKTVTGSTRSQISGFVSPEVSKTISVDIHGNTTTSRMLIQADLAG